MSDTNENTNETTNEENTGEVTHLTTLPLYEQLINKLSTLDDDGVINFS